jgi:hypothetical protein
MKKILSVKVRVWVGVWSKISLHPHYHPPLFYLSRALAMEQKRISFNAKKKTIVGLNNVLETI